MGGSTNISVRVDSKTIEKRAATDESVRLLNEFETKARENIIGKILVNDNTVNCCAVFYQEDLTLSFRIAIKFSINQTEYMIEETMSRREWEKRVKSFYHYDFKEGDLLREPLKQKFAEMLTEEIFKQTNFQLIK